MNNCKKIFIVLLACAGILIAGCGGINMSDWQPADNGGGGGGHHPAHHHGSYKDTCSDCSQSHNRLTCTCLDRNQFGNRTSLDHPGRCNKIGNDNGNLVCQGGGGGGGHHGGGHHGGGYQQTCSNCNTFNNTLTCTCQDANHMPNISNLNDPGRCRKIENVNGNLVCHGRH